MLRNSKGKGRVEKEIKGKRVQLMPWRHAQLHRRYANVISSARREGGREGWEDRPKQGVEMGRGTHRGGEGRRSHSYVYVCRAKKVQVQFGYPEARQLHPCKTRSRVEESCGRKG
ncbi:hypothetical protein E2C01_084261 [Portunus trituberculatus]|uniref:Uncharacterized protein n=1 Tax=Portunus trituberculatus TaxID=210409 RepID=A0A5B7IUT7_PORTR|nr:hypothetical protein [Portunus trituberculatus]